MIEVERLTKYYGLVPAISDLSFTVGQGEVVGFLGPNGAGKSTTQKILTCFLPPTSGQARINGFDIKKDSLKVREQIGYLPENAPLYREMTVDRFLAFAAQAKGIEGRSIKSALDKVMEECGLEKARRRIIDHLSKGFKQRVGLAQALLNNPPVLVLDEPTIGLDPAQVVEIRHLIRTLGRERTILLSTHILPEVSQVCQRVIIINRGRIVATDTVANLTAQLQTSRRLMMTIRGGEEEILKTLMDFPGVLKVDKSLLGPEKYELEMDKEQDIRADLAKKIVEKGWGLLELRSRELSLEEVFVQLVTEEAGESL
ncbi:MAG TPA: ATP-binding cassette domain-containing protein [Thermodesulfobacteriota bacterium]|nr:ATP-binding cassette domain-containing protein [Thermodesulfobacteriota bacterium]